MKVEELSRRQKLAELRELVTWLEGKEPPDPRGAKLVKWALSKIVEG